MDRRTFLQAAALPPSLAQVFAQRGGAVYAYTGCYTTEKRHGHGDGVHVYSIDAATGAWTHVQLFGDLINPSFLIVSRDGRNLYSVHGDERYATAFSIDPASGRIALLNKADTGGANGVSQALSHNGRFMVVANYGSGSVAVLPVKENGSLGDQVQLVPLQGAPGPHKAEQTSSHPHNIVFDPTGRFVLVPDKGLDRVFIFHFDEAAGRLAPTEQGSVAARAGAGPRHLAFHPKLPVVWVLNELASSTSTCAWDGERGALKPLQIVPSLPPDFTGESTAAEIAVSRDGRFVYCSNRGHDSVVAYSVNPRTGLLTAVGWTPSGGKTPRFIGLQGNFLYAANEQGDSIAAFRVNPASGRLTPAGPPITTPSPVTIAIRS